MSAPVLQLRNLSKSYRKRKVVENLSFLVKSGEVFGFLGPNGAGKSTTIRMMLALIKPDEGDLLVFNKSVTTFRNRALSGVGALIEDADFYENLSARRNLKLLARIENIPDTRIDEVLEMVELQERANDKVKAYSHGMKQRLGIAQALLNNPKLLVLDEPTTGLDPRGMKEVRKLVKRLSEEGLTIFLSSHLLHEVEQVCTGLAIINRGKLIKTGSMEDLFYDTDLFTTEFRVSQLEKSQKILLGQAEVRSAEIVDGVIKVNMPFDQLSRLNKILVANDIDVNAMIPRSSLEDYFLSLTEYGEA